MQNKALQFICGQLIAVGFEGTSLPSDLSKRLHASERTGVIWFRRNIEHNEQGEVVLEQVVSLNQSIVQATSSLQAPALIAVDQEGGRVQRLKKPILQLPPMATLGEAGDVLLIEQSAYKLGQQLVALGFSMNFAPVVDVHSNPHNPVIGDRSFSSDPAFVAECSTAYIQGLRYAKIASCAKHFPGHGDTYLDSHFALPHVSHDRKRLEQVELIPFYTAINNNVDSIMTAHVVFEALDAQHPATLSKPILTEILRQKMGFQGVCISDDLCMKGISPSGGTNASEVANAGMQAIEAGCDLLILAYDGEAACFLYEELVRRAEHEPFFAERCIQAFERIRHLKQKFKPTPSFEELTRQLS